MLDLAKTPLVGGSGHSSPHYAYTTYSRNKCCSYCPQPTWAESRAELPAAAADFCTLKWDFSSLLVNLMLASAWGRMKLQMQIFNFASFGSQGNTEVYTSSGSTALGVNEICNFRLSGSTALGVKKRRTWISQVTPGMSWKHGFLFKICRITSFKRGDSKTSGHRNGYRRWSPEHFRLNGSLSIHSPPATEMEEKIKKIKSKTPTQAAFETRSRTDSSMQIFKMNNRVQLGQLSARREGDEVDNEGIGGIERRCVLVKAGNEERQMTKE
ncbi:hypothetical protein R3P38DRAFT_2808809 [Favolaschia claudopus]|uniref:Uncharacterized protein n=1 Tax=Favolaschia claudopus TaxID=2862362 RepID=A0AAV9ZES1_9AGAR